MKQEGWDFKETLKFLATKAGVEQRPMTKEEHKFQELKRERETVLGVTMDFFRCKMGARPGPITDNQVKPSRGLEYAICGDVDGRGWTEEVVWEAGLGYFGKDWDELREWLRKGDIDLESPIAVALIGYRGDVAAWGKKHEIVPAPGWVTDNKIPVMPPDMLIYPHVMRGRLTYLAGRRLPPLAEGVKKSWNLPSELAGPKVPYFNHVWFEKPGRTVEYYK